jgi:hypothetical protein
MWSELKQRLLTKEHHMRVFFNSKNFFMINTEITRPKIYTRVDMRGTNHEIRIDEPLETSETKDNSNIHWTKWIYYVKIKFDKTTSWSSEEGVWEWPETRDLGKSTSDTWERVIADNEITGENQ